MKCSKCHHSSGDAWIQCNGYCPMWMSPYFNGHQLRLDGAWSICQKCGNKYSDKDLVKGIEECRPNAVL